MDLDRRSFSRRGSPRTSRDSRTPACDRSATSSRSTTSTRMRGALARSGPLRLRGHDQHEGPGVPNRLRCLAATREAGVRGRDGQATSRRALRADVRAGLGDRSRDRRPHDDRQRVRGTRPTPRGIPTSPCPPATWASCPSGSPSWLARGRSRSCSGTRTRSSRPSRLATSRSSSRTTGSTTSSLDDGRRHTCSEPGDTSCRSSVRLAADGPIDFTPDGSSRSLPPA